MRLGWSGNDKNVVRCFLSLAQALRNIIQLVIGGTLLVLLPVQSSFNTLENFLYGRCLSSGRAYFWEPVASE